MSTLILYNNNQILTNQPTPFIGRQDSFIHYGERWADKTTLTLHGQLTGCTYNVLIDAQQDLISSFAKDFQSIKIRENAVDIFEKPYVLVRGIDFPGAAYNNIVNYEVTLECYDIDLFSGAYGVINPNDEWIFEENVDGFINVTHNISAKGFNTTTGASNALTNAKDFVLDRTGLNLNLDPYFISTPSGFNPCLKSMVEKINRFDGSYGVTETYLADKYFGVDGVLRYTVNFDCAEDGVAKVAVDGTIDGCGLVADVTAIRARYETLNFYQIASGLYYTMTNSTGLNPDFIARNFNEDRYARKLTFNVTYDNITGTTVYLDYGVNLESGENGITVVSWNGSIKGRGDLRIRWDRIYDYYTNFNPFTTANQVYQEFAGNVWPLNQKPLTQGTTFDKFNGQINLNYSYDNKSRPWNGFEDLDYTLNFTPPIRKFISNPLLRVCSQPLDYYIADAGYVRRGEFSVNGHGRLDCSLSREVAQQRAITSATSSGNQFFAQYFSTQNNILEVKDITRGLYDLSFKLGWSSDGPEFILVDL